MVRMAAPSHLRPPQRATPGSERPWPILQRSLRPPGTANHCVDLRV